MVAFLRQHGHGSDVRTENADLALQERMANMLNDCEISPTNYMIAFLRQRGWAMPEVTMRIPNVIPEVDTLAARVGLLTVYSHCKAVCHDCC